MWVNLILEYATKRIVRVFYILKDTYVR